MPVKWIIASLILILGIVFCSTGITINKNIVVKADRVFLDVTIQVKEKPIGY